MKIRFNATAKKSGQLKRLRTSVAAHYRRFAARVDFVFRILSSAFKNSADTPDSTFNPDHALSGAKSEQNEISGSAESQYRTTNAKHRTSNEESHPHVQAQQNTFKPPRSNGERNEPRGIGKAQPSTFNGEFGTFDSESASRASAATGRRDAGTADNPQVNELLTAVYGLQQTVSGYARNHVTQEELRHELASLRRLIETKGK